MENWMQTFPVDTGRKMNVLCPFNLRFVSTGLEGLVFFSEDSREV